MLHSREIAKSRRIETDSSDAIDINGFVRYVYRQRTLVTVITAVAVLLTGGATLLVPAKYTATASILIESPAGNDPRGATAVSPVYLESLKTYEHFASSDSLFRQAFIDLELRAEYPGVALETIKRRVLKVKKPKDEKVLEISATLTDRIKAQKLAYYIAEKTIKMNRALEGDAISDLSRDASNLVQAAAARVEHARAARETYLNRQPIAPLEAQVAEIADLKARSDRNLADAEVELAATMARVATQHADKSSGIGTVTKDDVAAIQAQVSALSQQSSRLAEQVSSVSSLLERRKQERELLDKEVQAAQAQYEAAAARRTELLASGAFRGERLEMIDPGVVPERPSSPNLALNLVTALIASVFCSIVILAFRFGAAQARFS